MCCECVGGWGSGESVGVVLMDGRTRWSRGRGWRQGGWLEPLDTRDNNSDEIQIGDNGEDARAITEQQADLTMRDR